MLLLLSLLIPLIYLLRTLQKAYLSPLSRFPSAHPLASFTPLYLLFLKYQQKEVKWRQKVHEKLGPVVRVGPDELSICDAGIVKIIFAEAGAGFEKNGWFKAFVNMGEDVLFSTIHSKPHTERKRMISHLFSKSYINTSPELNKLLDTVTSNFTNELQFYINEDKPVDCFKLSKSYGMDATSGYVVGLGLGTNFIHDSRTSNPLKNFETGFNPTAIFYKTDLPQFLDWTSKFGVNLVSKDINVAWDSVESMCSSLCEKAKVKLQDKSEDEEKGIDSTSTKTVYATLHRKIQQSNPSLPLERLDKQAAAEVLDQMLAGNDGVGITITYLMLELANHPETQTQLRQEIRNHRGLETSRGVRLPSAQEIEELLMIDAVLQETMRLHPAALGPWPRVVPAKGATIKGVSIPAGTVVSASQYSLHMNADIFPGPEEWRPERWIEAGEQEKREMMKWFWTFGSGGRMCIGNHLAIRMMKAFIFDIYRDFEGVSLEDGIPEQVGGLMGPPNKRPMMKFRKVS